MAKILTIAKNRLKVIDFIYIYINYNLNIYTNKLSHLYLFIFL